MMTRLLTLLACPKCALPLRYESVAGRETLECRSCRHQTPIVNGIPRFIDTPPEDLARRTQASFGYEWTHFNDWQRSGAVNFNDYFAELDLRTLRDAVVLDAGCGMGRHARQIAPHARQVVAVDFSEAIDQAARNVAGQPNVDCLQADILSLPLADGSCDFVYSLGVLHHLTDTERAVAGLVRKLRPGGRLRIYLYWKRHGWSGALLRAVTWVRRLTTRLPFPLLRALCRLLSAVLLVVVVLPYRVLSAVGVRRHEGWPLFVYAKYPFAVLYNDQFDRFSAPLEKRYDPDEVQQLLEGAGLREVRILRSFGWIADGIKSA